MVYYISSISFFSYIKPQPHQEEHHLDEVVYHAIGQTNRVLINMTVDYNPRQLAISIRQYFEKNSEALEVMIIKGGKMISVIREDVMGASFIKYFMMKYTK